MNLLNKIDVYLYECILCVSMTIFLIPLDNVDVKLKRCVDCSGHTELKATNEYRTGEKKRKSAIDGNQIDDNRYQFCQHTNFPSAFQCVNSEFPKR